MSDWGEFGGVNQAYVLELYERFLQDPSSVDAATRAAFERFNPPAELKFGPTTAGFAERTSALTAVVGAVNLAESIRRYGHLASTIDPLGSAPIGDPSLNPETHGVTAAELRALPAGLVGGPLAEVTQNAWEAIVLLREVYCSSIGFDLAHIFVPEEREWLRQHIEARTYRGPQQQVGKIELLDRITEVETFERFLHKN